MKKTILTGTRNSRLAVIQAGNAVGELNDFFPCYDFQLKEFSSPGDRDKKTDLQISDPDFFTRDLDEAVINGEIDCAIHSAKDLPPVVRDELDWFWLPNPEDSRDVIVLRDGVIPSEAGTIFGNSSDRRGEFIKRNYPNAVIKPLRGTIEERIAKLDAGEYDALIMASAALNRLNLENRISEWIDLNQLTAPDGQGFLAITFRKGDVRFKTMRNLFAKSVTFVSAGVGDAGLCTMAGVEAIKHCDVCLYDALMPRGLTQNLSKSARAVYVGKRSGAHSVDQSDISQLIAEYARQGKRVVRLKGGDSGTFGRLAEEIDVLDELGLAYTVLPGVSTLNVATTGTGMLLTRRGMSRGFKVITTSRAKDSVEPLIPDSETLPTVIFMGISKIEETLKNYPSNLPVSVVFEAGMLTQEIISGTVETIAEKIPADTKKPGIILIGETADESFVYKKHGIFSGKRIWVTCSEALQPEACRIVRDFGGEPIGQPLIQLTPTTEPLPNFDNYDWIILSSPSAVDCLMQRVDDVRKLPKILACGPGSERALRAYKLSCDLMPESDFSTVGIVEAAKTNIPKTAKILRLRSDAAGFALLNELKKTFDVVDDFVVCHNSRVSYETAPVCDAIFLASPSACVNLIKDFGREFLEDKELIAIGSITEAGIRENGLVPDFVAVNSTVRNTIEEWAHHEVLKKLENI